MTHQQQHDILFNYKINKQTKKLQIQWCKICSNSTFTFKLYIRRNPVLIVKLLYGEILLLTSIQIINYQKNVNPINHKVHIILLGKS